jgi:hypothetical protein
MTMKRMQRTVRSGWSPTMEQVGRTLEGKQVKCLTADEGHVWMDSICRRAGPTIRLA